MWRCRFCFYLVKEDTPLKNSTCPHCKKPYALCSFDPANDEPRIPDPDNMIFFQDFAKDTKIEVELEDNIQRIGFKIGGKYGETDLEGFRESLFHEFLDNSDKYIE